jgi:alkylation response protein AidB-like acyl-CoA dehydrogenase
MSDERELLRETVAALVAKHASPAAVREAMESERGYDESLWRLLCEQVGAAALVVPEEFGGAGGTLGDAAVVVAELGKGLVPSPLLGTTLAELALLAADQPDADALGSLAEGAAIGAVVFDADYVINGDVADIVIAAHNGKLDRWTEFSAEALRSMDPTRRLGRLTSKSTSPLGTDPGVADAAAILLAAEQIGAATRCLDLTVDYTKERQQFGRPIGSFQALKHRMADLLLEVESLRSALSYAAAAVAENSEEVPVVASLVKAYASETYFHVAAENIQIHGGIGFTWEHDAHLYFKRAKSSELFLGDASYHRERLATRIRL